MDDSSIPHSGFTLVELMVVVLIIGILVSIAVPVFQRSRFDAEKKSCQANQRTISGAIDIMESMEARHIVLTQGELEVGSDWYNALIPGWIRSKPICPVGGSNYLMSASGDVMGDSGAVVGFKPGHQLP